MEPTIRAAHGSNFGTRGTSLVDLVVIHTTEGEAHTAAGLLDSAVSWFQDPRAQVSAHYVVGAAGELVQCVPEGSCAWHAGNRGYNYRSIGIECAGHAGKVETWTAPLLATLVDLLVEICQRHHLVVPDRAHIIGHCEVPDPAHPPLLYGATTRVDPGPHLNWTFVIGEVQRRLAPPIPQV